ncbi:MAG TPA: hypothetical protein VGK02_02080 [Candidatus Aquicultor sp.]|jgi:hypothetical protein
MWNANHFTVKTNGRKATLWLLAALIAALVVLPGCRLFSVPKPHGSNGSTTTTVNAKHEEGRITPTREMDQFFKAIKPAERVIFIQTATDTALPDDNEQVPLSVYDISERMYWSVTQAVLSATADPGRHTQWIDKIYTLRWYKKGYKKAGELRIDTGTGEVTITYPKIKIGDTGKPRKLYLQPKDNELIKGAAELNRKHNPHSDTETASPGGRLI